MSNSIYGNNANIDLQPRRVSNVSTSAQSSEWVHDDTSVEHLTSIYDTIVYLSLFTAFVKRLLYTKLPCLFLVSSFASMITVEYV